MSATNKLTNSKFFNTDKEKTDEFFKNTKIGSCSHILVKNGVSVAVPFNVTNSKGKTLNNYKTVPEKSAVVKSVYRKDYSVKPYMHVGMASKPLVPYEPNSYRNRLSTGGIVMSHKNKSNIEIGDSG
jgi:hypothetical protein